VDAVNLDLAQQIDRLEPGGHLCLLYENNPAEQLPALVAFIRNGLSRNEQVIYIADDQTTDELASRLEQNHIDVAGESRSGRLKLYNRQAWRQPGELDPQKKAQQVRQFIAEAAKAGFKGIRFGIEMTWTLGPDIEAHDLEHWEATINTLFQPSFPARMICQYNRARLAPEVLLAALHTHPAAIVGTAVFPNPFYEAPLLLNGNGRNHGRAGNGHAAADRVDWMLGQLERARAAELDRQTLACERAQRLQAEQARKQAEVSEQRLRALLEHSPEWVEVIRPDGTIAEINAAGLQMVEAHSAAEVLGKSVFELIAPEDRSRFEAMHQRVCNGTPNQLEVQIVGLKGSRRWVETHAAPVPDPVDNGWLHLGVARDITDRKRADLIARHLSAVVESSDDAIISKDLNGIIKTWNSGAERMFGYTAQEVIGKPITIIIPTGQHGEETHILNRIRSGQRIDHFETVRRRKDGTLIDISLTVSPVKDNEGQVVGASKIARDITLRKRADNELRAARDELHRLNEDLEIRIRERTASLTEAISQMQEFSYTISHDLRAPARTMKSYARIVLEDFGQNLHPDAQEYLQRIIRGGDRMDRLIQDVLTYTQLSRRELKLQPVSLDKLIGEIIQQYPKMQPPRASVSIHSPLPEVMAHEPSLAQALSNLLSNAVKFVPPGESPKVIVRTEQRDPMVRLWVEDNGIGIKPQYRQRIFGMFERLPTDLHYEGTGVGLAIVRKAAERMGGSVGVESDGFTGSRFWIELQPAPAYDSPHPFS
jgi:PAS domain S-box-containing protein